jgi:hypothetical protein
MEHTDGMGLLRGDRQACKQGARAHPPRPGRYVHRCIDAPPRCQNDLPMSTTGRRILTAKTMALAVMAIVFAIVALWHRRRLDAGTAGQPQPLPPRQAQLVGAVQ